MANAGSATRVHANNPHSRPDTHLHDQSRILVALLRQGIELGNSIIESEFGESASLVGRVQNLVVEYREVECKSETDWVRRRQLSRCD